MKKLALIIVGILLSTFIYSQNLGARIYSGISVNNNENKTITPSGKSHMGHYIGLDARLTNSNTSIILGGQFARIPIAASNELNLFNDTDRIDYLKARVGFDIYLFPINDYFKIRAKVLANYYMVFDYERDALLAQGNGKVVEGMASGIIGVGIDIKAFIIDLEYDHGFQNAYEDIENSRFNAISIAVGFHF